MRRRVTRIALYKKGLSKKTTNSTLYQNLIRFVLYVIELTYMTASIHRFANRLTGIKENAKFQKNGKTEEQESGLKHVVRDAKEQHNVK